MRKEEYPPQNQPGGKNTMTDSNKLNQAISASGKNFAYEIKINYLVKNIKNLKQDVVMIKDKTA